MSDEIRLDISSVDLDSELQIPFEEAGIKAGTDGGTKFINNTCPEAKIVVVPGDDELVKAGYTFRGCSKIEKTANGGDPVGRRKKKISPKKNWQNC